MSIEISSDQITSFSLLDSKHRVLNLDEEGNINGVAREPVVVPSKRKVLATCLNP